METSDWVLVCATISGPILAVLATRLVDYYRQRNDRRYNVFVGLMTTRATRLNNQHIEAINKVEIEFSDVPYILNALRRYMELLDEPYSDGHPSAGLIIKRRNQAFAELVQSIGRKLRRRVDKLDLTEGGYYPQGLADLENLHRDNAEHLNALLKGQRALHVSASPAPNRDKFPPPPGD